MLLFRLPAVEFQDSGALQHQTAPWKRVNIQVQLEEFMDALKNTDFSYSVSLFCICWKPLWPSAHPLASPKRNTHLDTPGRSLASSVSPEGYGVTRVPFLPGDEIYTTEESGRAQKHMIGWHPWPHTHGDATKWLPHAQKIKQKNHTCRLDRQQKKGCLHTESVFWDQADWWVSLQSPQPGPF